MKLAPVARALASLNHFEHIVVHTGQHYDTSMSQAFFRDLGLPEPHHNLGVGSGSHAEQTALVMQRFESVCRELEPDLILVYGDVNSTVAAALVGSKLLVPVGHVEAGLRSRDRTMPEEINRILTDQISDLLFAPSEDAVDNLLREGIAEERIYLVGNVMIDTLISGLTRTDTGAVLKRHGLAKQGYVLATLHRPSNVDQPQVLGELISALAKLAERAPVVLPAHPRTLERLSHGDWRLPAGLRLIEPLPYLEMLALVRCAELVITDSGGVQEETTFLSVPCITVRSSTERPVTCTHGTNRLVASRSDALLTAVQELRELPPMRSRPIPGWDGRAAERIALVLDGRVVRESPRDLIETDQRWLESTLATASSDT